MTGQKAMEEDPVIDHSGRETHWHLSLDANSWRTMWVKCSVLWKFRWPGWSRVCMENIAQMFICIHLLKLYMMCCNLKANGSCYCFMELLHFSLFNPAVVPGEAMTCHMGSMLNSQFNFTIFRRSLSSTTIKICPNISKSGQYVATLRF